MPYRHPYYRRNADQSLREIERRWLSSGAPDALETYLALLWRGGYNPYWVAIREHQAYRDSLNYDAQLHSNEKNWREYTAQNPNQDFYPEPEVFIKSHRHPDGTPRWEDRPLSGDKKWDFYLHIPRPNGKEIKIGLGELRGTITEEGTLHCTLAGTRDYDHWDLWEKRALSEGRSEEAMRANFSLANGLHYVGDETALLNIIVPDWWQPNQPVLGSYYVSALNDPPTVEDRERPFEDFRETHNADSTVFAPEEDFLVTDFLLDRFLGWLESSTMAYSMAIKEEVAPLEPRLPDVMEGKHVDLYYWLENDGVREIEGTTDPTAPEYQQHRYVYDVGYRVTWYDDSKARFWRWSGDPGHADVRKLINATRISFQVPSKEEHAVARQRAWEYLQNAISKLLIFPEKHGYTVHIKEGDPRGTLQSKRWLAGLQFVENSGRINSF